MATSAGIVSFEWYPDPLVVANELKMIALELEDMFEPLEASAVPAGQSMQRVIESEGHGQWPPWSERYAPIAEATNVGGMLWRTGELYHGLDNPENFVVEDNNLFFTGEALPERWLWHQEGRQRSRGGNLPARPFVELDPTSEVEIIAIFDMWLSSIISVTSTGQARLPSGRFGPKL